jgi:hypothetical protein
MDVNHAQPRPIEVHLENVLRPLSQRKSKLACRPTRVRRGDASTLNLRIQPQTNAGLGLQSAGNELHKHEYCTKQGHSDVVRTSETRDSS